MDTFWDSETFNKDYADLVQFRVAAFNVNGWSENSEPNTVGARVLTVPRFMHIATRKLGTGHAAILIEWNRLTTTEEMGGSAIVSYGLQYRDNSESAEWIDLIGYQSNNLLTDFILDAVTPGQIYQFRMQAKNIYGWGVYSEVNLIAASGTPA